VIAGRCGDFVETPAFTEAGGPYDKAVALMRDRGFR
jgi:hypothetical protein